MKAQTLQITFFFSLLAVAVAITFFMFLPYFAPLLLAATLTIIFHPFHEHMRRWFKGRNTLATVATMLVLLLLVLLPLTFLAVQIFEEAQSLYQSTLEQTSADGIIMNLSNKANYYLDRFAPEFEIDIRAASGQAASWLGSHIGSFFSSFLKGILNLFLTMFALFFFLRDGHRFKAGIMRLSPLDKKYNDEILTKLELAVNSVIRGTITIAIIQGLLASIGFLIFDIPNAILFGSLAAITSLVPTIGTAIVLTPAIIYLFATGNDTSGIGLLIWSFLVVGLIDNFLGPIIIDRGIKIHPMLILFAVLGGLQLFGPLGFIVGPLALSFLFALLHIYLEFIKKDRDFFEPSR